MKLLDYFFYVLAHDRVNDPCVIENPRLFIGHLYDDRRGCGFLALWSTETMITLFSIAGLLFGDTILKLADIETIMWLEVSAIVLSCIFISVWYFDDKRYLRIFEWRNRLSKIKRRILYTIFLVLFWPMPIATFITYRLCVYGQIKWW